MEPEPRDRGLWTIPNLISALRLLAIPWFVWLLLHEHRPIAAGLLLAALVEMASDIPVDPIRRTQCGQQQSGRDRTVIVE